MTEIDEPTWDEAMRRGHAALIESERMYEAINEAEGRWRGSLAARASGTAT